jgi:CubicO group peptidase (beta-lactamase class C family)
MKATVLALFLVFLAVPARPDVAAALDDYFARAAAHGFSGSVLVARGEEAVLRKGYGLADRRKGIAAMPDTAFNIASLDKQFIAAAILHLEEMGKLRTDDPLRRFFDFVPNEKKDVTLHQLLSHTSGLGNEYWDEHPKMNRAQFVHFVLAEQPLAATPGAQWLYSNSGFIVLEQVIEVASGRPYEEFLRDALFRRAGMRFTGFALPHWKPRQVAHYDLWTADVTTLAGDIAYNDPLKRPPPSRVLLSTVDDLRLWWRALRDGRVLTAASRRKLFTPVRNDYGYGWNIVRTTRGTRLLHHGGSGSSTGMLATFRYFVDEDVLVTILSNTMRPDLGADYIGADVEAILFGGAPTLPPPAAASTGSIAGHYGAYDIVAVKDGPLVLRTTDHDTIIALLFPSKDTPQDSAANGVLGAASTGDYEPLRTAAHAGDDFIQRFGQQLDAAKKRYGNVTGVTTIGQRAFVFEGAPEIQSYERVDFERGSEVLRVIHLGSGLLTVDRVNLPPGVELVLAPSGPGRWTTWDFKLGAAALVTNDTGSLVIRGY